MKKISVKTDFNNLIKQLIHDERGVTSALSLILLATIVCLGAIVGLTVVRNQVAQEFGDIAVALDNVDQSFSAIVTVEGQNTNPMDPYCYYAVYIDDSATLVDLESQSPACLNINQPPQGENGVVPPTSGIWP